MTAVPRCDEYCRYACSSATTLLVNVDDFYMLPMERILWTMMLEEDTLVIEVAMYCLAVPNHCPFAKYGPIG
jgi:hypothetical protein